MARTRASITFDLPDGVDLSVRDNGSVGTDTSEHEINASLKAKF